MKKRSCSEGHFLTVSMIFASNILVISSVILFHTVCNKIKKRRFTRWEAACFSLFWYLMSLHLFHDDYNLQFSTKATKMRNINQTSFSPFSLFCSFNSHYYNIRNGPTFFPIYMFYSLTYDINFKHKIWVFPGFHEGVWRIRKPFIPR